jgi:hypothetical protein
MANYDLPAVVEKRVRYFDGQFLQDQDFIDEQDYQLDREHRHNRLLHAPGVAEGLAVTSAAANQVTVAPGTALDSDGHQLVLAQATTVDLPAKTFNNQQGVQLYLSYLQSAEDPQTTAGSADFTRWLERPELTALVAGQDFADTSPPVLLAKLALDGSGRVAVDITVRSYAGVRLPGPAADAPALASAANGTVELAGSLAVDGSVGVGTVQPGSNLHVNVPSSGTPVHAMQIDVQSFQSTPNAQNSAFLQVRDIGAGGTHFLIRGDGMVGVGTGAPAAKLDVAGGGGTSVDLQVNGRLRSNNNDGGLWVAQDRFIGGLDTTKIGIWNGNAFRLTVLNTGSVGIGTTSPGAALEVAGAGGGSVDLLVNGRLRSNSNDGGLWVSSDRFIGGHDTSQVGFYNGNAWRLTVTNTGPVGIATISPVADLEIGTFDVQQDRWVALKAPGGNLHRVGLKLFTWQENYGYSVQFDERNATGNGFHVRSHNKNADGVSQLFVGWSGNVGISTTSPAAKLDVVGGGGTSVDLQVNGRLRSNSNDGGLWVAQDRFVGGVSNMIGFWSTNAWRMVVTPTGTVGIGTTQPDSSLHLSVPSSSAVIQALSIDVQSFQTTANAQASHFLRVRDMGANATHFVVRGDGTVGIGTAQTNGLKLWVAGGGYYGSDLFVNGKLAYWWGPDGAWKQVQNRASDYAGSYSTGGPPSDLRLKADLRPIGGAMDLVRQLSGQRYRWGADGLAHFTKDIESSVFAGPAATEAENRQVWQAERQRRTQALAGDHIGLVAQDVEAVLPELVRADEDGYKHISYQHLTAVLVEAIKEQDAAVRALTSQVAALRQGQPG